MALTFLARMRVRPEKQAQFIALCRQMEADVKRYEPDCLQYQFFRLREPNGFGVIESFKNEAAEQFHREAEHSKVVIAGMLECLEDGYSREYLDPLE
jgi:(4S)-4-hydroxy-5-phosphonooxypentane-2,3-dione isomerase